MALFVAAFLVEGWLRPAYDPRRMFVSELALGPRGWVQVANFVALGALLLVFAREVSIAFPEGKASRAGPILLAIIGVSFLLSGPLVMDPVTTPRDQLSWHGRLHDLFGALVFSLSPASCFVFWRRFRADSRWRSMRGWTLVAGIATLAARVLFAAGPTRPPAPPNAFNDWNGALQRFVLIPYLTWLFTFSVALARRAGPARAARPGR